MMPIIQKVYKLGFGMFYATTIKLVLMVPKEFSLTQLSNYSADYKHPLGIKKTHTKNMRFDLYHD